MWLLMFLTFPLCVVHNVDIDEALKEVPGLRYMGTKSPYIFSSKNVKTANCCRDPQTPKYTKDFFQKNEWKKICKPVHASLTVRHGNRLPSLKNMVRIESFAEAVRDLYHVYDIRPEIHNVDSDVFRMIKDWKLPYQYADEKKLNNWGYEEIYEIAKRFSKSYKGLFQLDSLYGEEEKRQREFKKNEILEDLLVISSSKSRSINSAKEFLRGVRDVIMNPFVTDADIEESDSLMRFHSTCTKFKNLWDEGKLGEQLFKYMKSDDIIAIGERVAKKLGLAEQLTSPGQPLDKENAGTNVWAILNSCYAETAQNSKISPWCHLLEEEDFKKLDFSNDLKHYYKNTGYVESTGASQSCPLLQHIFQFIDKTVVARRLRKPYKRLVFRFGHAETLIPLFSLLGLYREPSPLTADYQKHRDRLFNLRLIAPHSTNLQIFLYHCSQTHAPIPLDQYMIQVLINEVPVVLPPCEHVLCPYKVVKEYYRTQVEFCDYDQVCDTKSQKSHDEL